MDAQEAQDQELDTGSDLEGLIKSKLGANAFKEVGSFHIHIVPGKEADPALKAMVRICPANLYHLADNGTVTVSEDGCLECGTCLVVCGGSVLEWRYPDAQCGVQYRLS